MATATQTVRRKALRGVVAEIKHNCCISFIRAEVEGSDESIVSEVPKEELNTLNLRVGDSVDMFPLNDETYLIIGKN